MCIINPEMIPSPHPLYSVCVKKPLKKRRRRIKVQGLNIRKALNKRKKKMALKREMEMKNWRLHMENESIMEENEKLRQKARLLHHENQALLSQLASNQIINYCLMHHHPVKLNKV